MTATARVALGLVILLAVTGCAAEPAPQSRRESRSEIRDLSCLELAQRYSDAAAEIRWYVPAVIDAYDARDVAATQTAYDAVMYAAWRQELYAEAASFSPRPKCDDWPENAEWAKVATRRADLDRACRRNWEPLIECWSLLPPDRVYRS